MTEITALVSAGIFTHNALGYLSPFMAGGCMAGATVVGNVPMAVVLLLAAALFGFFSLPTGDRMIRRMAAYKGLDEL